MSDKKVFDFKTQLELGKRGEEFFLTHYPEALTVSTNLKWDFDTGDGKKLELKLDDYDMAKTPNFFMERYSDWHAQKPGGPWRSLEDGIDRFIYYFVRNDKYFEFNDVPGLVKKLDEITEKLKWVPVKNKGWITTGYRVPRDALSQFCIEYKLNRKE